MKILIIKEEKKDLNRYHNKTYNGCYEGMYFAPRQACFPLTQTTSNFDQFTID